MQQSEFDLRRARQLGTRVIRSIVLGRGYTNYKRISRVGIVNLKDFLDQIKLGVLEDTELSHISNDLLKMVPADNLRQWVEKIKAGHYNDFYERLLSVVLFLHSRR